MKKKILNISVLMLIMILLQGKAALANEIKVFIDGKELVTDVAPEIINNRTVLPMRAVFEGLGARVEWFQEDKLIFAMKDDILIALKIGSDTMTLQRAMTNEKKIIVLDIAPFIKNNRTIIPVRAVSEALDAYVDWIGQTSTVIINSKPISPKENAN